MKRIILALIIGVLLLGANVYALDGDFIVERLGIGIDPPNDKLHVAGDATLGDGTDTSRYINFDRDVTDQKFGYDNTVGHMGAPGFSLSDSIYVNRTENFQGYYLGPNGQYGGFVKKNGYPNPLILSDTIFLGTDSFGGAIALDSIWDSAWAYCEGVEFDTGTVDCADYNAVMTVNDNFWVWRNGHNAGNPGVQENRRDLKFVFDGESNDGVMGFMEDEDYFYYDDNVVFKGNVGIGTDTPNQKLSVNGAIELSKTNFNGIYFDYKPGFVWRTAFERPAIYSQSFMLGNDDNITEIYLDTFRDGAWAYCEGVTAAGDLVNCADYAGIMDSNDYYWVWKHGSNSQYPETADYKFVFDGESNDGVMGYMEDEDAFYFDEKLGIGTTTPDSKLHVVGSGHFTGDLAVDGNILGDFTMSGNVGIGTSSPGTAIEVAVSSSSDMIRFSGLPDAGNTLIETYRDTGGAGWKLRSDGAQQELFFITDSLYGQVFTVDVLNKEVGVGVSDPLAKFHIAGDGTAITGGQILISGETDTNDKMWIGVDTTDNYGFMQSYAGGVPEDLILNAEGGNVGIGTVNPEGKLHTEDLLLDLGTGNCPTGYAEGNYGGTADADCLAIGVVAKANGNVGIGMSTPSEKLYVTGNIYATGNVTWGSSRELKENIRELSTGEALTALNDLQPKKYYYKADNQDEHIGFIAEEIPDLLATKDKKSLDPMDIVAVLTSVVKEQQKMAEEQQKIIKNQQKEMEELKVKVQRLESKDLMVQVQQ